MNRRGWFFIFNVLVFVQNPCNAQSTNASIYGTVADASGAVVAKARVVSTNTKTGVAVSTVSNEAGIYIFAALQPGEYSVSGEAPGFRKAIAQHVQLEVSARISVDLNLEVGATTESINVEASSSPLETVNTSVSNVVSLQRVQDLPLQNRDAGSLVALQAGVVGDNFNGVRSQSQNVTLEGVNIQETRYNGGSGNGPHSGISREHGAGGRRVRKRHGAGADDRTGRNQRSTRQSLRI